jgi:myo-inositol-1(or 4)-monophosphatase
MSALGAPRAKLITSLAIGAPTIATRPEPNTVPVVDELSELRELAEELARRAGALLLERLEGPRSDIRTKSSATDMVSEVDHFSQELIIAGIRAARPDDAILAEEGADLAGSSPYRWVVDPLDGTTNYLYGHPGFGVSIAVEDAHGPMVGVVNDPVHGELFRAVRGGGATRNGAPVEPGGTDDPAAALVATGFAYEPTTRRRQAGVLVEALPRVRDLRRMGAAAVDLCSVACGRVDAYFERGLSRWDFAAGMLVASEAGARVGSIDGGPPVPESVLAANPALFEPLRRILVEAGATD